MQTDSSPSGNSQHRHDVVVVGAGLAGLTAAITVARAGRSVLVFDARSEIGGRARTEVRDGFALNEGPHALYRTGAAFAFLGQEGLEPAGGEPAASSAVGGSDAGVGALPAGPWSLLRTPLLVGERLRFGRVFAGLGRLDTVALDATSTGDAVERMVGNGRSAQILHALLRVATYGNDVHELSAGAAIAQLRDSLDTPVLYVDGGWGRIIEGLESRLLELGGEIVRGRKVATVSEQPDGVEVLVGDDTLTADAVVLAAGGPRQVESLTGVDPAPFARPSTVATLDVGLAEPWGDAPTFAVGLDEPLYCSVHAPVADLAPSGSSLVSLMRYHPFGEVPDAAHDRRAMEGLLDQVRPGWRAAAAHVSFRARLLAAYDQPQAGRGGLAGRAGVTLDGHERVVVAGDWVGPEGLLADAACASAVSAASTCLARAASR